ncbi:GAF sensor signal transduction histidine kinase [Geobacter metallireducens RCH3]|uniref:histidine kinase n=1 Tax=Geobacter metallireducens (strain ATCC 53774 / DSM 7210 / GS-15) TaxID=269799 RepID=Q39QI2_GEOMG|nr:ATP-binding protein [Geobacter metallireducens]ABB33492.1 sensor histidine kinase, GAF and GAF domain-containing [Geobacter metallireducens GS-15]EHP87544.1 GAF sensor signal transduction histidine kinase [Geobacter metallireducens RCH3]
MAAQNQFKIASNAIRIANSTEHPHHVRLKAFAHLITEAFHCSSATIYLADERDHLLHRKISTLLPDEISDCIIPFGKGVAGRCAAHARPIYRGISSLHPHEPSLGTEHQVHAHPIIDGERLLGVLTIGLPDTTLLDGEDLELLQVLLIEAAGIIRRKRSRDDMNKRLEEFSFLYRISNAMLSTIKLNRLVHLILSAITSGTPPVFDRAMLFLANERTEILQGMTGIARAGGPEPPADLPPAPTPDSLNVSDEEIALLQQTEFCRLVKATRLPLDSTQNHISKAVLDRQLVLVRAPRRESPIDRSFNRKFGGTPFAIAPLIAHNQVIGAIVVDNCTSGRPITPDELNLLQLFTNQAGMAAENSILYNRLEETNRNLHETQERLLQGEKLAAIGQMAAGIAHEIKNPLVSVGGFAGRLKRRFPADTEEWQYADLITREVQHLETMLTDILFFSKKTTICYSRCSINQIIEDALSVVALPIEEKGIKVEKILASRLPSVLGDYQQIRHVFINLFSNANDVMEPGGVLEIESLPAQIDGSRAVSVKVSDTGAGILLEHIHTLFSPFFTTKEKGTGLGLAIAHKIITAHGGTITVKNRETGGAEFTVVIPVSP